MPNVFERGRFAMHSLTPGQRIAQRLAQGGFLMLLLALMLGLVGGVVLAAVGQPPQTGLPPQSSCTNPPCFEFESLPGVSDLPFILAMFGYLVAIILSVPSLLVGVWHFLRGRWAAGGRWCLLFLGPLLFFIGTEILPHVLNPCFWALEVYEKRYSEVYCAYSPEWGADVADRWHLLAHTLVGALPLAALYWWALRRWWPAVTRFHRIRRSDSDNEAK